MNNYEKAIETCVRTAMGERLSCEDMTQPLVKQLAVIAILFAKATGTKLDDIVEIIHHNLDEETVRIKLIGDRNGTKHPR